MEAAGIALAVLPLLLNQLDNYVQGIETFRLFGAKRYRRELEWYRSNLASQQTILQNTLMNLLDGVEEYGDGVDGLIQNPLGVLLQREDLRTNLRKKLGTSFDPFCHTMNEFSILLNDLYRKLGFQTKMSEVNLQTNKSFLKKELKKFKDIFSKSIYDGMFTRLDTANNLLKILVEQSDPPTMIHKKRHSKRPLIRHRRARKFARSLHNAIFGGKCWSCPCRDRHAVHFILKYPEFNNIEDPSKCPTEARFRMVFASHENKNDPKKCCLGLEVETETETVQSNTPSWNNCPPQCLTGQMSVQKNVQLSVQGDNLNSQQAQKSNDAPIIFDICVTLSNVGATCHPDKPFGCFSDDIHRHNMYYIRDVAADLGAKSLSDLIKESSDYFKAPTSDRFLLTQKQRLRLAVNLACSVLQFHGSWLKVHWRAKDIMFSTSAGIDNPFVQWNVGNEGDIWGKGKGKGKASSPLIQSDILFPLGLILVELSLCQTLEALRTAKDEDQIEACADLKTAARFVNLVEQQSGTEYKKVVKACLFWPGSEEFDLDNEQMQDDMFRLIVWPLIENLRIFEGGR